jgi:hypothetical protein
MNTLYQQNDKVAKNLFNMGTSIMADTDDLAKRRQDLQSQLSLSPTAQSDGRADDPLPGHRDEPERGSAATQCGESPTRCAEQIAGPAGPEGEAAAGQKFIQQQDAERAAYGFGK